MGIQETLHGLYVNRDVTMQMNTLRVLLHRNISIHISAVLPFASQISGSLKYGNKIERNSELSRKEIKIT